MVGRRVIALMIGLLVGGVILAPATAGTISVTMADLIQPGASFTVGDKIFADWDYSVIGNGKAIDPKDITITAYEVNPGLFFLDYHTGYSVEYDPVQNQVQSLDILWHYTVATTTGLPLIKDISLYLQGYGTIGNGLIHFSETVADGPAGSSPNVLAQILGTQDSPNAWKEWSPPVSKIWVTKNLFLFSGLGAAHISQFRQDFSQQVPEASTCVLFGLGIVGASLLRRRRKK